MSTQYGQTLGSFIRNSNYPLEADYIFESEEALKSWEEQNRKYLHEGLFKVVVLENEQILYWYCQDTFKPLIKSDSLEQLAYVLRDFELHGQLRDLLRDLQNTCISKFRAFQQELDETQAGAGLNGDGTFDQANMRDTTYLDGTTSIVSALKALDKEISNLVVDAFIQDAYYDASTEEIVITFLTKQEKVKTIRISMTNLIREWEPDNTHPDKVVEITREEVYGGGADKVSADVRLSDKEHNILKKDGNTLIVKGTTDNIYHNGIKLDEFLANWNYVHGRKDIIEVEELPSVGHPDIIYMVGNVLYKWTGSEFKPMGTLVSTKDGNQLLVEDNQLYYNTEIDFNQGYIIQNVNGKEYKRLALFDQILVSPTISSSWTIKAQDGTQKSTSSNNSITVETGAKVDLSSTFKWVHTDTNKDPRSCSGSYGTNLPASGVNSSLLTRTDLTTNSTFTVTLSAPKQGLMVSGTSVVAPSGNDTKSASCGVTFQHRRYWGITTSAIPTEADVKSFTSTNLSSNKNNSANSVTTTNTQYYCYAYPKALGVLSTIIQDGAEPVLGAFTQRELNIVNEYGATIPYYVYTTNNPGAFTNATLEFK